MPFVNGKYVVRLPDSEADVANTHTQKSDAQTASSSGGTSGTAGQGGDSINQYGAGANATPSQNIPVNAPPTRREINNPVDYGHPAAVVPPKPLTPVIPATPAVDPYAEDRKRQMALIQQLMDQAQGKGSVQGMQQLQNSYRDAASQQLSAAMSGRGNLAGAQGRMGQQGAQNVMRHEAGGEQMLKLQSQANARNMLGQLLAQAHGQDLGQAGIDAQKMLGAAGLYNQDMMNAFSNQYRQGTGGIDTQIAMGNVGVGANPGPIFQNSSNVDPSAMLNAIRSGGAIVGSGINAFANGANSSSGSSGSYRSPGPTLGDYTAPQEDTGGQYA